MSSTNIGNLVTGQFAQAQNYANTAQTQVASFLETLNTAAAYTVPTIDVTWNSIAAPDSVALPAEAVLDAVTYEEPTLPDAFTPEMVTVDAISYTPEGAVVLAGRGTAGAAVRLPVDAMPDVTTVQVSVMTQAPGLSPVEVERVVTVPVTGLS